MTDAEFRRMLYRAIKSGFVLLTVEKADNPNRLQCPPRAEPYHKIKVHIMLDGRQIDANNGIADDYGGWR